MIKAIFFDLGGVLFTNGAKEFVAHLMQEYHLEKGAVEEVIDGPLGTAYRKDKMAREEFWTKALSQLGIDEEMSNLEEAWENSYKLIPETRKIILELSKKFKIYFVSDSVPRRVERLSKRYNFLEWFEDGVFSYEVGARKPDPKIYQHALKKANVNPQEVVYIDDKEKALVPAKEMGMTTILFTSPQELRHKLRELKVL